jgi:ribosomal protein S18 acetylase RimI-like enzyme
VLEGLAARAWRAAESAELGGWRLNASSGFSGRINACWPTGDPGRDVTGAIAAVEAWYAERGLAPTFKLADGATWPQDLADHLAARGYRRRTETLTMTGLPVAEADPLVSVDGAPGEAFRRVFANADFGPAADAEERLGALGRIPRPRGFASLAVGGAPAAIGACAVEDDWAGVFAMRTAPACRRQGLGRRVLRSLLACARQAGATRAYLQVEADNQPAVALYRGAGFEEVYRYRY